MWPPRSIRSLRVRITTDTVPVLQFASSLSSLTLMKSALAAAASSSQSVTIRTLSVRHVVLDLSSRLPSLSSGIPDGPETLFQRARPGSRPA
jgi:hypothetical protein